MQWLHEAAAPVAHLSPQTVNSTPRLTDAVDMSRFHEIMVVFLLGDMANETIDVGIYESTTAGGSYTALPGKQATQLAASATANDGKIVAITVKADELSIGRQFLKGRAVTGGATGGVVAMVVLGVSRFGPSSDDRSAAVLQIVV
jgi:hypothetical protein